ncbi:hypothetical protein EVG20_g67 [Dentipellis fragilis]|uniref:Major facilitator superfamily (MFS) profile domain-containing protein n=1 Tax=Dentipellis fragilis TaxID=205917 RepID=A0A4Y9ZGN1_9AGAM|nr:hypothetical protein EVG20_g67 [Dentipellis fragilis]
MSSCRKPIGEEYSAPNSTLMVDGSLDVEKQDNSSQSGLLWKVILMGGLIIPVFLETLDYTVVATAQPHIAIGPPKIGTIYLLTSTVFLPLFASISDVYGRYVALQLSLFLFLVGSAICTAAQNFVALLAGRGISGIGAAGMTVVVRVILADSNSLNDNNWQSTILSLLYTVGYVVGPVLGGVLTSASFRWVFAINLPCTVIDMLLAFFLLRSHLRKGGKGTRKQSPFSSSEPSFMDKVLRLDWIGSISFIGCLLWEYILEREQTSPTPSGSRILWAEPILPLDIFRSFDVCAVQAGSFVSGMVMLVLFYFVSIFMTIVNGLSATSAGAQLLYLAPGMGGGTYIAITMVKRLRQPKYPIVLGGVLMAVSLGLVSMALNVNNKGQVNGFMAMAGIGIDRVAAVISLTLFFRSFGGTVGLAQCAAVMNGAKVATYVTSLVQSGAVSAEQASALALSSDSSSLSSVPGISALSPQLQEFVKNAFRNGVRWSFISLIPWAVVAVILTVFLSNIPDTDSQEQKEYRSRSRGV